MESVCSTRYQQSQSKVNQREKSRVNNSQKHRDKKGKLQRLAFFTAKSVDSRDL